MLVHMLLYPIALALTIISAPFFSRVLEAQSAAQNSAVQTDEQIFAKFAAWMQKQTAPRAATSKNSIGRCFPLKD